MTDLVSTIDSGGGGDYTTWQAWEDACSSDLVADGNNWIGEQIDEEITTSTTTTISGITTDATNGWSQIMVVSDDKVVVTAAIAAVSLYVYFILNIDFIKAIYESAKTGLALIPLLMYLGV